MGHFLKKSKPFPAKVNAFSTFPFEFFKGKIHAKFNKYSYKYKIRLIMMMLKTFHPHG